MIPRDKLLETGRFLLKQDRLRLLMHVHPDGDVVGSCLALARFLEKKGKNVAVLAPFPVAAKFDFLPGFVRISPGSEEPGSTEHQETLYVVADSTGVDRTGFAEGDFARVLRLDHHINGASYDRRDLVDTRYAATALLVADLLRALDEPAIDAEIATSLLTGLMTDTGGFRYSSTDAHAFRTAAFLMDRGASPARIATLVYERRHPAYLALLRNALDSLSLHAQGRIALLVLKSDGLPPEALTYFEDDDFINLPRSLETVEVVIQMKRVPAGDWKIGFRGKGRIDVQKIAYAFGGGGHYSASGCELEGAEDEIRGRVLARTMEAFGSASSA
jgi:phosphoesterase RecJ-like protein